VTLVLDAGAFVAVERGRKDVIAAIKAEWLAGRSPITHGGVVGQVWRGGDGRQATVARMLAGTEVAPLDERLGKRAGVLLGRNRSGDVVDAAVVVLAADGDLVLTSDPKDLHALAAASGTHLELVAV
jgi:hypothetical protein